MNVRLALSATAELFGRPGSVPSVGAEAFGTDGHRPHSGRHLNEKDERMTKGTNVDGEPSIATHLDVGLGQGPPALRLGRLGGERPVGGLEGGAERDDEPPGDAPLGGRAHEPPQVGAVLDLDAVRLAQVALDRLQLGAVAFAQLPDGPGDHLAQVRSARDAEALALHASRVLVRALPLVVHFEHGAFLDGVVQMLGDDVFMIVVMLPDGVADAFHGRPLFLRADLADGVEDPFAPGLAARGGRFGAFLVVGAVAPFPPLGRATRARHLPRQDGKMAAAVGAEAAREHLSPGRGDAETRPSPHISGRRRAGVRREYVRRPELRSSARASARSGGGFLAVSGSTI